MRTEAEILADWHRANDEIQAAYWRFTRCARALPPSSVCPVAYASRARLEAELSAVRESAERLGV